MKQIFTFLTIILLFSCQDKLAHQVGDSDDIKSAKKRGVFICELKYTLRPNSLQELYKFKFKEVFVESLWRYGKRTTETDTTDPNLKGYCHIICVYEQEEYGINASNLRIRQNVDNKNFYNYVSERSKGYLTSSPLCILNIRDTISYDIYKLTNYVESEKIGQIMFYPKNEK